MGIFLERWTRFVARWPWLILLAWLFLIIVAFRLAPSIDSVSAHQNTSSLPASAPSMQAQKLYVDTFSAGQQTVNRETDLLVLTDPQGISQQDIGLAEQVENWLNAPATRPAQLLSVTGPNAQTSPSSFESSDHQALRLLLSWDISQQNVPGASLQKIDSYLAKQQIAPGGTLSLTGSAPINYDLSASILSPGSAGIGSLLGLLIILVVLALVYRSPLAVIVPLLSVGGALALSIPLIAWCGQEFGVAVASFSLEYVGFVLLGAGTNYGVFMLSRYKEEIQRRQENTRAVRREALANTVGHIGESIASSAATVVIATGIMGLAQLYTLRVTGPAIAIGVICLLLAGLSLLPALMALCGKALFWPAMPRPNTITDATVTHKGFWAGIGRLVTTHPRTIALVVLLVLVPLAALASLINPSFDDLKSLPATAPSVQAFTAYQLHFHDASQATVLLSDPGHDLREPAYSSAFAQISTRLAHISSITGVQGPTANPSAQQTAQFFATDGSAVAYTVLLANDASSNQARQTIGNIYTVLNQEIQGTSLHGAQVLITGQSAQVYDEANQFGHDFTLVVILVSIAILIILALLVRSFLAPFYLLGTIALSALSAVSVTNLIYNNLLGKPLFSIVPIFAFVFLVSLGEDFNILTIARIREEVQKFGNRRGIATAIALTGGTVSSCGLVMAASFSRLASNAIVEIAELGFTIVIGVLIDTFVVRPLLVPALATLLGRWNWLWPNSLLFKKVQPEVTISQTEEENMQVV